MWNSGAAAGAFVASESALIERADRRSSWAPENGPLPALFLSHGAPPLLEDADWIDELARWADDLPRPRGIVIVSAHWESAPIALSATETGTPLVYDFGGFHPDYFSMSYATPDSTWLADRVAASLPDDHSVVRHSSRGLDHGAWVPLKVMYPAADVPVVQMSIPTHDPARLLEIGAHLRELRDEGVLIIGSGFGTHGLPFLTAENIGAGAVPSWSAEFDDWFAEAAQAGDVETLANYSSRAPGMPYAHPTVEHFSPVFVALGAAADPEVGVRTTVDGFWWGLARRSFQVA